MLGIVEINGKLCKLEDANISVLDRGFLFGDSILEVLVGFSGVILNLDLHLKRLRYSAELLQIKLPWSNEQLQSRLLKLSKAHPFPKAYIRLVITSGSGLGLTTDIDLEPNIYIYILAVTNSSSRGYPQKVFLKTQNLLYTERFSKAKINNYQSSILALKKVKKEKYHDILWINSQNEITESSTSNIFFIQKNHNKLKILTPSTECGLLPGITRKTLLTIFQTHGLDCEVRRIKINEIETMEEAFLSSTIKGLIPIQKINLKKFNTTEKKSFFYEIQKLFILNACKQIGKKIDWKTGKIL